jgi:uncharacterized protein YcbX
VALTVTDLFRHPVKSCRGEALDVGTVERWGFAGDRRWMIVDAAADCITAREFHQLVLVVPQLVPRGIVLRGPHADELFVPTPTAPTLDITVHKRGPFPALLADEAAHEWFGRLLGEPVRLVYQADPSVRVPNQAFAGPDDRAALQDAYPYLVITRASLQALDDEISRGRFPEQGPMAIRRFRPNIVVDGDQPWAEDGWRRVRIGDVTFRAVKGCDRCVLTTVDPDTGVHGKEPIATLARIRQWDHLTWFGMNLVPDVPAGEIRVGAAFEVLEEIGEPDGPPR